MEEGPAGLFTWTLTASLCEGLALCPLVVGLAPVSGE